MTTVPSAIPSWLRLGLLTLLGCLCACGSYEEVRIRQLMNEKGFGTRANGDATHENYVDGLSAVQFMLPPEVLLQTEAPRLAELAVAQPVGIDGTIFVPYVGPVYVLGKTEAELTAMVRAQLSTQIKGTILLQARILPGSKIFYAIGESRSKGPIPMLPDMTLMDAMFNVGWTNLANLGRVYVIRPDAENPLVIDVNFREMLTSGDMKPNIQIRERDILYVPPTFLGLIARLLQRILEPFGLAVRTMLGIAEFQTALDVVKGDAPGYYFRY